MKQVILFFSLIQLLALNGNAQNSLNLRLENGITLFPYKEPSTYDVFTFGTGNQLIYTIGGKFTVELNENWILGIGLNYHKRKIKDFCVYWPVANDTVYQLTPGPIFGSDLPCTHHAEGKIRFVEIPLTIGYNLYKKNKWIVSCELEWSPLYRLSSEILYVSNGSAENIEAADHYSRIASWKVHGLNLNLRYKLGLNWSLLSGFNLKSDDFSYKRMRFGANFGVEYQLLATK